MACADGPAPPRVRAIRVDRMRVRAQAGGDEQERDLALAQGGRRVELPVAVEPRGEHVTWSSQHLRYGRLLDLRIFDGQKDAPCERGPCLRGARRVEPRDDVTHRRE